MLKFEVNGKKGNVILNLPTSIEELTKDYLINITNEVNVGNNYSLIALCHREKLSAFIMAGRNKKNDMSTAVVPIFIKHGSITTDSHVNNINVGDKLIIAPSNMAMGLHVNISKNTLTMGTLLNFIDGDGFAYQNALKYKEQVYFIEFKIIPNCDIVGYYKDNNSTDFDNPFAVISKNMDSVN